MQPRRHRMRKQARRDSALDWVRSGARVTVKSYAKRYGVDRYTAHDDLTAIGFALPAAAATWAQRPPSIPREALQHTVEFDDEQVDDPDGVWVGDQRMFVVGYTTGGAPFGCYADELEGSSGTGCGLWGARSPPIFSFLTAAAASARADIEVHEI